MEWLSFAFAGMFAGLIAGLLGLGGGLVIVPVSAASIWGSALSSGCPLGVRVNPGWYM